LGPSVSKQKGQLSGGPSLLSIYQVQLAGFYFLSIVSVWNKGLGLVANGKILRGTRPVGSKHRYETINNKQPKPVALFW